jgi:dihydroflavonol-4-reductase
MSAIMGKRVFVTGGTGFLGSHLLERLCREGAEVTALYRSDKKLDSFKKQDESLMNLPVTWLKGDLFSDWSLTDFDCVYHLAGFVGYSAEERKIMERVNFEGTASVLKKIEETNYKCKLIYSSSVVAVGASKKPNMVIDENFPYNMSKYNFGYFETKRKAENLVFDECSKGLKAVILNPSTIYGPRDLLKGSRKFQLKMAKGDLKICSKGGVSVVHVKDVCDAFLKSYSYEKSGERFILSGDNVTIYELLSAIAEQTGVPKPKYVLPTSLLLLVGRMANLLSKIGLKTNLKLENIRVATMYHWFRSDKAQKELGFEPRGYKEALSDSLSWAKKQGMF